MTKLLGVMCACAALTACGPDRQAIEESISYLKELHDVRGHAIDGNQVYVEFDHRPSKDFEVIAGVGRNASRAANGSLIQVWSVPAEELSKVGTSRGPRFYCTMMVSDNGLIDRWCR
ncbi:MAG TPA: hypothetical protein VGA18_09105 [Rhodothermales bacterium]